MSDKDLEEARKIKSRGIEGGKPDSAARGFAGTGANGTVATAAIKALPKKSLKNAPPVERGLRYLGDADTKPDPYVSRTKEYPRLVLTRLGGPAFVQNKCNMNDKTRAGFTYICKDEMQYFYNSERGKDTASPVHGYRSKLIVEIDTAHQKSFDAIERADGFTQLRPTDSDRIYVVAMRARPGNPHELAVTGTDVIIHQAKFPSDLDGCIAPGTAPNVKDGGILHSREALDEIIDLLGGWEWTPETKKEKPVRLLVRGFRDTPG